MVIIEIIQLVTAILVLVSTLITYRHIRNPRTIRPSKTSPLKLVQITTEPIKRWPWKIMKWAMMSGFIVSMFFLITSFYIESWLVTLFWSPIAILYLYCFIGLLKRPWEAESKVRRREEIIVEGDYDHIISQCQRALKNMGARIISLDSTSGVIDARMGISWRSWGEKLKIQIQQVEGNRYCIQIKSDSILPTTLLDFGKNSWNVRSFIDKLLS